VGEQFLLRTLERAFLITNGRKSVAAEIGLNVSNIIKEDSSGLIENGAEWVITYSNSSNDEEVYKEADNNNEEGIEEVLNCYQMYVHVHKS
jgi:hypothetical protein